MFTELLFLSETLDNTECSTESGVWAHRTFPRGPGALLQLHTSPRSHLHPPAETKQSLQIKWSVTPTLPGSHCPQHRSPAKSPDCLVTDAQTFPLSLFTPTLQDPASPRVSPGRSSCGSWDAQGPRWRWRRACQVPGAPMPLPAACCLLGKVQVTSGEARREAAPRVGQQTLLPSSPIRTIW